MAVVYRYQLVRRDGTPFEILAKFGSWIPRWLRAFGFTWKRTLRFRGWPASLKQITSKYGIVTRMMMMHELGHVPAWDRLGWKLPFVYLWELRLPWRQRPLELEAEANRALLLKDELPAFHRPAWIADFPDIGPANP